MSLLQPLYSTPKLLFSIFNKKKVSLEQFEPFSIQIENIYANDKHLARFTKTFGDPDDIPTFAFITAFKASLQCLSQAKIPSSIIGLIHLSSEFQLYNKHNWLIPFNIKITVNHCEQSDKGLIYTVVTDFYQRGKLTISNTNVMLDKSKKYRSNGSSSNKVNTENKVALADINNWSIKMETAWSYARTSGDFNPIHLHPVLAMHLGLPNMLIHGMYNASKTISELRNRQVTLGQHFLIEFNRPCFIPNTVHLKQYESSNEYGLFSKDNKDRFLKLTLDINEEK